MYTSTTTVRDIIGRARASPPSHATGKIFYVCIRVPHYRIRIIFLFHRHLRYGQAYVEPAQDQRLSTLLAASNSKSAFSLTH